MPSVVIAAHNEESVIGACLDAVHAQRPAMSLEVIVSANGCTDGTVRVTEERGVTVIDRSEAGKAGALNAAEEVATQFPRFYLDADIILPPHALSALTARLDDALAVVPRRRIDTKGRPLLVKAYFVINERLPVFRDGLFGRGCIGLSDEGRARFDAFPSMVADDLFLDSQFTTQQKLQVDSVEIVVAAPLTTKALVQRLVRVRRGNVDMRAALGDNVRASNKWSWLRDVVLPHPWLIPAAIPYVAITVLAGALARRDAAASSWGRDDSTRRATTDRPTTAPGEASQ